MPIHPNDSDKTKMPKTGPDTVKHKSDSNTGASNLERGTEAVNYGIENNAKLRPSREVTEDQEYKANGLARTNKYSVDNTRDGGKEPDARKGQV